MRAAQPGFGRVEADPAEANLSVTETYFEERRPFFTEGDSAPPGEHFQPPGSIVELRPLQANGSVRRDDRPGGGSSRSWYEDGCPRSGVVRQGGGPGGPAR